MYGQKLEVVVLFRNKKNHARFLGTTGGGSAGTRKNYAVKIYRFISQLRKIIYTSNESTCIETTGKPCPTLTNPDSPPRPSSRQTFEISARGA